METTTPLHDERMEKIFRLILEYSKRNFGARETASEKGDELDAVIIGLNTLGEELAGSQNEKTAS